VVSAGYDHTLRVWGSLGSKCDLDLFYLTSLTSTASSISIKQHGDEILLASEHDDGSVRCWKLIQLGNKPYLQLMWSTFQNALLSQDANLEGARGLSLDNADLLKQRGAIGEPVLFEDAPASVPLMVEQAISSSLISQAKTSGVNERQAPSKVTAGLTVEPLVEATTATTTQTTTPLPASPTLLLFSAVGSKAEVVAANSAEALIASASQSEAVSSLENSKNPQEKVQKLEELGIETTKAKGPCCSIL